MSIYTECADAARRLLDDPGQRISTEGPDGIFTELDVIFLAARDHHNTVGRTYSEDEMRVAQREASQAMGMLFRTRQAVRFGPVRVPGFEDPDYMRIASKIVYGSISGPEAIKTPNGTFPQILVQNDTISRQGRRGGAERNDLELWADQFISPEAGKPKPATTAEQREILRLRAENAGLLEKLESALADNERLKDQLVDRATVERWVEEKMRLDAA